MIWLMLACGGPSYDQVSRLDTIEAYEAFLEANPDSAFEQPATQRLEELYFERAEKEDTQAGWEAYLARFKDGAEHYPEALKKASRFAFDAAMAVGSTRAFEGYLETYGKGDRVLAERARGYIDAAKYGGLKKTEPKVGKINLGEDPAGELNGWGVSVDVTNEGSKELPYVRLSVVWSNGGAVVGTRDYPLVAEKWAMPASELQMTPLKGGETRTWTWTEDFKDLGPDANPTAFVYFSGARAKE